MMGLRVRLSLCLVVSIVSSAALAAAASSSGPDSASPAPSGPPARVVASPAPLSGELAQAWSAFDDSSVTGPFTLLFRLDTHDGKPAVGRRWTLVAGGLMPGDPPARQVAEGTVPESGLVEVTGLAGIEKRTTVEELKRQRRFAPWYTVMANGRRLGQVSFFEWGKLGPDNRISEILPPSDGKRVREREYKIPPEAGETAPDVTLTDLATRLPLRLSDLRGQVVLLEFWSSKCHSCESVMEKNEELLKRRGKDWLGKAMILAANIDQDIATVTEFLRDRDWKNIHHAWSGEGGTGQYSQAARTYVVTGTPVAILIGRDGRIAWRGSPWEINLEQSIDQLLAGGGVAAE